MSTDPLVKALQRGDLGAIESLYDAHADDVLRWVVRLGGPHLSAEDVAHEVFVQAIRSACRFRGESSVRTWLFGITRGTVANARRRSALRRFVGLDRVPEPHGTDRPADHLAIAAQERRLLQSCLDELTTRQRVRCRRRRRSDRTTDADRSASGSEADRRWQRPHTRRDSRGGLRLAVGAPEPRGRVHELRHGSRAR